MHAKVGVADARDNGNFMMKSSTASVLSQLSKLALGSACFVLAVTAGNVGAHSAKKALFADALSVSPGLISWTSDLHPNFKAVTTNPGLQSPLDAVVANSFNETISADIHLGLAKIARLEKTEHLAMRRAQIIHVAHTASPKQIAQTKPVPHEDAVAVSQSSVKLVSAVVAAPLMTEAQKLQGVQSVLISRFFTAMNDGPKTIQVAQAGEAPADAVNTQTKIDSVLKLIAPQPPKPTSVKAVVVQPRPDKEEDVAVNSPSDAKSEEVTKVSSLPAEAGLSPSSGLNGHLDFNAAMPTTHASPVNLVKKASSLGYPPSTPLVLNNAAIPAAPSHQDEPQPAARLVEPSSTLVASSGHPQSAILSMAQAESKMWTIGYPSQKPINPTADYPKTLVPSTHAIAPGKTATQETGLIKGAALVDKIGSSSSSAYSVSNPALTPTRPTYGPLLDRTSRWAFHEAFDWSTSVVSPQVEILSQEGAIPDQIQARGQSSGQTLGWRIAKASQHWATLFWSTPNQEEVPMLNALSAKMLSVKAAAALQTDAGIILAKVPAGWSLELSGRSERPLIFDRTNHILALSATEGSNGGERYYVFLNAAPGEQILYLNHAGGETGALAIPVLGGVMAYADLTQVEKRTISGRILEAADNNPHGVPGIHVQVVGSGSSSVTNNVGEFHIDNVIAFGDQSLYIEAETQKSFPHRYKLSPSATTHLSLFHLDETQVHEWISQLEGGVSSESGLILGAIPTLAASQEDRKPLVGTRSLANSPTLTPETYTLSGSGQLLVTTPLNGVRSRFISVQVPEGPTLIEVVDKDNRLIWSEITVVSPRVLTIVGPY